MLSSHHIFPIGESALTVDFGTVIDQQLNEEILSLYHYLNQDPPEGVVEVIPAYSSITIYYDVVMLRRKNQTTAFDQMKGMIEKILKQPTAVSAEPARQLRIPVCYDGNDLDFIATEKNMPVEEVVRIHSETGYHVYMIGFLPGFPYLGKVDERIRVSRRPQPAPVSAGSVGIAGMQTGIYPLPSPGGWRIIGHTPITLFDTDKEEPTFLRAGDTVRFYPISIHELTNY